MDDLSANRQPNGILRYRRDADGAHVGIIPATCRACGSQLHKVGFRARQHDDVMVVDCDRCTDAGLVGQAWRLAAREAAPDRIELDPDLYVTGVRP